MKDLNPSNYLPANDNFLDKLIRYTDSKGVVKNSFFKQAIDVGSSSSSSEGQALGSLITSNTWAPTLYSVNQSGSNIISHSFITYKNYNGIPLKDMEMSTEFQDPFGGTVNTGIVSGNLQTDPNLKPQIKYVNYDDYGNILQLRKNNDYDNTMIWDYKKEFPIAKIFNATNSQVAYTSFEADGKGNWTFTGTPVMDHSTVSGKKVYPITTSLTITKSGLEAAKTYFISYWAKGSAYSVNGTQTGWPKTKKTINGWTCYEHKITGITSVTISGNGFIDEVRLYPDKSQISTYCYDPLKGISTQIDANHIIVFYHYDEYGRLVLIRDENRNILKKYCYSYLGLTDNCPLYGNVLTSSVYTRVCPPNSAGSQVTYTVPENTYFSTTQLGANDQAQADKDANGQNNANSIGTCTVTCSPTTCTGNNKKCINGVCQTGVKVYTASIQKPNGTWQCFFHYEWSDGSWSQTYSEVRPAGNPCPCSC